MLYLIFIPNFVIFLILIIHFIIIMDLLYLYFPYFPYFFMLFWLFIIFVHHFYLLLKKTFMILMFFNHLKYFILTNPFIH